MPIRPAHGAEPSDAVSRPSKTYKTAELSTATPWTLKQCKESRRDSAFVRSATTPPGAVGSEMGRCVDGESSTCRNLRQRGKCTGTVCKPCHRNAVLPTLHLHAYLRLLCNARLETQGVEDVVFTP